MTSYDLHVFRMVVNPGQTMEGGPLEEIPFFEKKVSQCEKTERGLFSLSRYGMLRGKRGKTFLVQSHYISGVSLHEAPTKNQ